jgi:hypothetical protein
MKHSKLRQGLGLAAALAVAAITLDYRNSTEGVQAQAVRTPLIPSAPTLEPRAPIGPAPVVDLQSAVTQTAAVVQGQVVDIQYDYSDEDGPWTRVLLADVRPIAGDAPGKMEIRHFGGRLPNGGLMVAAELPVFVLGKEYIVFLRSGEWNVSAVVGDLAYRVETVDDAEVLVDSDGRAVVDIGAGGVEVGAALFDGPQMDGSAPKPLDGGLRLLLDRKPVDRQVFAKSLDANLAAQGLRVAGTLIEKPAGLFQWRKQLVAEKPGAIPVPSDDTKPEADSSDQK